MHVLQWIACSPIYMQAIDWILNPFIKAMKIRRVDEHIVETSCNIGEGIPLNVYLVMGDERSVLIDSGIKNFYPSLQECIKTYAEGKISYVLNTHSHHDHIGCNGQLVKEYGCKVLAPGSYAHWHSDFEAHYQEFARPFPNIIADTPQLREEVMSILDYEHTVDKYTFEGLEISLANNLNLRCLQFTGHMKEESGWLLTESGTLILGDVITLMDIPFLHGYMDVAGFKESMSRLEIILKMQAIDKVLFAHYPQKSPTETIELINQTRAFINKVERTIMNCLCNEPMTLEHLWRNVVGHLGKEAEFRSLSTVHAHVEDLTQRGEVQYINQRIHLK